MKITVAASGPADPAVAWDRYVYPARWHEWSPQIQSVEYPDDRLSAGGSGTVHGPCLVSVHFEILDMDSERRCWSWRVTVAGITLTMVHAIETVSGADTTGSRTTLVMTGPPPIVLGYLPIARIALGRLVR